MGMLDFLLGRKKQELPKRDLFGYYEKIAKLNVIEKLPAGVVVRAIKPKTTSNKWSVQFNSTNGLRKGTVYYGPTLHAAIREMLWHDELASEAFYANGGALAGESAAGESVSE